MTDEPSRDPTVAPDATDHEQTPKPGEYPGDVRVLDVGGRQFVLVGTAHISRQSVDLVREVIERERPDCVCVELDPQRYAALAEEKRFEAQDLRQIIANRQLATLLMNLVLGSYQKRLGMKLGVTPGSELLEATKVAEQFDIPISLCDRDIRITLRRAWHSLSLWRKFMLMSSLLASAFESPDISEEELARIREKDVLSELMKELGDSLPELKRSLIDERDAYLAQKIRESEGNRIVAVVGAGHLEGMIRAIEANQDVDIEKIEEIPAVSSIWTWVGWAIPFFIVGSLSYIGWAKGFGEASDNALYWFLANAIPTGIGGLLALAHPVTIVAGFFAAPFTSLTPLIGAGYVAAFVQTWLSPPTVAQIRSVGDDIATVSGWWSNRLLKILLVFLLTTLGSAIGTWVGGIEILKNVVN